MININQYIEHTALNPQITDRDIERLVQEAETYQFLGICVPPFWVKKAKRELEASAICLVTVIGFPFGYDMTETKLQAIQTAMNDGVDELDVVMNISSFKSGMNWVKIELAKCAHMIHRNEKIMKVIIETAYLDQEEIIQACKLACDAGADFIKTSTGHAPGGAIREHITLMRSILPKHVNIKASGGINSYAQAKAMIEAGADRIGTSSGITIMNP